MTLPTQLVLHLLLEEPTREWYGLQLGTEAGLPSGTIHPILARLEKAGWLISRWEDISPTEQGRPRRRYYQINPSSLAAVQAAVRRADTGRRARGLLHPRLSGGPA